jgi:hypothetical protein
MVMTSLLDDTNRMLKSGYGDPERLKGIKEILEQNKMLYVSERKYLIKLVRDHTETPKNKISNYGSEKKKPHSLGEDLDIQDLEEKIRVESEPS